MTNKERASLMARTWIANSVCRHDVHTKGCGICMAEQIEAALEAVRREAIRDCMTAIQEAAEAVLDEHPDHPQYGTSDAVETLRALLAAPNSCEPESGNEERRNKPKEP